MIIKRSVLENLDCGKMILDSLSDHLPATFIKGKINSSIINFPEMFNVEKNEDEDGNCELVFTDMNGQKIMDNWDFCDTGFLQVYAMLQLASLL